MLHPEFRERATGSKLNLQLDEIDTGHFFGDGVLDLEARVGLDEREARLVTCGRLCIDEEFERAEVVVAHLFRHPHRSGRQPIANCGLRVRG